MAMARFLIGKILVRDHPDGRTSGRIVETEAYPPGDASGHAYRGETPARRSLFLRPGHSYVYMAYGSCYCVNVSSEPAGVGAGVLIRALEPLEGIALMQRRRDIDKLRDLARGPGRLTAALAIGRDLDGIDLCVKGPLWLALSGLPTAAVASSVRIGISREARPSAPLLRTRQPLRERHQATQRALRSQSHPESEALTGHPDLLDRDSRKR
jgi:DNA-3-methyladenine glycosylase